MLDCLRDIAYPKRAHDGIALEELLCSAACSVAAATEAAGMLRVVRSLFDATWKGFAYGRVTDYFMIGGDVDPLSCSVVHANVFGCNIILHVSECMYFSADNKR